MPDEPTSVAADSGGVRAMAGEGPSATRVARTHTELAASLRALRGHTASKVALVPTMGALHDGHLSLVAAARKVAPVSVVSIFVNPTQFAANEDLATYPRNEDNDLAALRQAGVDLAWLPTAKTMYPDGFCHEVMPGGPAIGLESVSRPHFFGGVATVVAKLFNQVRPDYAVFGEKDYQQLCVVQALSRDLDLGVDIIAVPTMREDDGLALSSRNAYLSDQERAIAPALYTQLHRIKEAVLQGEDLSRTLADAHAAVLAAGFNKVDYIEAREAETLALFDPQSPRGNRILAAAWLGKTRLIDNIAVPARGEK